MAVPASPPPRLVFFSKSVVEPASVESLHAALKSGSDYHYLHAAGIDEVKEAIARSTRVVLLVNGATVQEIAEIYPVLAAFEARVAEGTLKVILLNAARHPRLRDILRARLGVEVVDPPIAEKAMRHKLKQALLSVHRSYERASRGDADPVVVSADARTPLRAKPKAPGSDVLWQPPAEFDSDFWWIPEGKSIRLVVGIWLVDLVGPGPAVGTWESVAGMAGEDGERAWAWRSRWLADETFQTRDGLWIFFGRDAPEFSPAKKTWCFTGKRPKLAYFPAGSSHPKHVRFEYRPEDGFLVGENSASAKTLLPRIQATFAKIPGERPRDGVEAFGPPPPFPSRSATDEVPKALISGTPAGPLTPTPGAGNRLGLDAIEIPGIAAGEQSFVKMGVGVDVVRKNGELGDADLKPPAVYHVTKTGATLLLDPAGAEVGDRFHFRFKFAAGAAPVDCLMEWEMKEIEMAVEEAVLARGDFVSGDLGPLAHALDAVEERKRELREFYRTARG